MPIAGWYPDPQDARRSRWWDGTRWGELAPETAAAAPAWTQPSAVAAPAAPAWTQPSGGEPAWHGGAGHGAGSTPRSAPTGPTFSVPEPAWQAAPRPPAPSAPQYRGVAQGASSWMRGYDDSGNRLRGRRSWAEHERASRAVNPASYTGLLLAVIGVLINPFAILSILAIVFGAIGLGRAGALTGARHTGRGLAMAAVLIGIGETMWLVARIVQLLG